MGTPDKQFSDEDDNVIFLYYSQKMRLTFYEDESFRLGYIITSNAEATLLGLQVIGKNVEDLKNELPFKSWEVEDFDSTVNHFNESNWLIVQSEYDEVIRIEIGAINNDKDEFDWKFKA
jgi:hypothetical protein